MIFPLKIRNKSKPSTFILLEVLANVITHTHTHTHTHRHVSTHTHKKGKKKKERKERKEIQGIQRKGIKK